VSVPFSGCGSKEVTLKPGRLETMTHRNSSRPLSPHLTAYRWGPHMLVSILHRITGAGASLVGGFLLVWWLVALAGGAEPYQRFTSVTSGLLFRVIWIGLSWAVIQHTLSGLRHLVMDVGAGFELRTNRFWAVMTLVGSVALTALFWVYIWKVR